MKKKPNLFLRLLFCLFIVFIVSYIITKTGYYENKLYEKTVLTDKKIKEFENDIKSGKVISLDNYYVEEKKDYSSFLSTTGRKLSNTLSNGMVNFFTQFGKVMKKLFW